jgi:hypothetical protein
MTCITAMAKGMGSRGQLKIYARGRRDKIEDGLETGSKMTLGFWLEVVGGGGWTWGQTQQKNSGLALPHWEVW